MQMDQHTIQRTFALSLIVFVIFALFILQARPLATLSSLSGQFELLAGVLGMLGELIAVYVVWRMYQYLEDTEFGRVALLGGCGLVYLAIASVFSTLGLLDAVGVVLPELARQLVSVGTTYFTLFKGAFILLGFIELQRFLKSPQALPSLLLAFKRMLETESGRTVDICEPCDDEKKDE
ncbi:MAG: hypothetical protein QF415_09175 [Candidatus Undinarchaeales archaeon]|nr:hypothetical protein [Candidatus Undinarchaeales archaeon]